ncbi:MAG: hypothetical protein PHF60_05705 [Candidatus ainarchaeum sp.]|nr:hypothetical protein [Candidatus ainarchaeum sp.]
MAGQLVEVRGGGKNADSGFKSKPTFTEANARRLHIILTNGFAVGTGYSMMSRDRHYVHLTAGTTSQALLSFCESELNGNPLPDEGQTMLNLFKKAEAAGLVTYEFVKAQKAFLPEMGRSV